MCSPDHYSIIKLNDLKIKKIKNYYRLCRFSHDKYYYYNLFKMYCLYCKYSQHLYTIGYGEFLSIIRNMYGKNIYIVDLKFATQLEAEECIEKINSITLACKLMWKEVE